MTRILSLAVALGVVGGFAGCGGGSTAPEKVTPEVEAAQKKQQLEADDAERNLHTPKKKK